MALSRRAMLDTQPGACTWVSERGFAWRVGRPRGARNGGDSHRRAASCRARSSRRAAPSWPSSAAIACVISAQALMRVSVV